MNAGTADRGRQRTWLPAALAVGAVVAAIAWWIRGSMITAGAATQPPEHPPSMGAEVTRAVAPGRTDEGPGVLQRQEDATIGKLLILVQDQDGKQLEGCVHVETAPTRAGCVRTWNPSAGRPAPNGMRTVTRHDLRTTESTGRALVNGRCDLDVPTGHWTWLCVSCQEPRRQHYLHVAPFSGRRTEQVVFAETRGVHVFVYDPSLSELQADAAVELAPVVPGPRPGVGASVWQGRTDAGGYAFAPAPRDGMYLAHLQGEAIGGDGATGAPVVIGPAAGSEAVVVLAAPERRVPCRFHIRAAEVMTETSWLLARLGSGRECVIPLAVASGKSAQVEVSLPLGEYLPQAAPDGTVCLESGAATVEVQEKGANEWTLTWTAGTKRDVLLRGIDAEAVPLSVRWVADDDLLEPSEPRTWTGPARWHRLRASVSVGERPARLLASSRLGCWISEPVAGSGPLEVALRAACLLEVQTPIQAGTGLVAQVDHGGGTSLRILRPVLVADEGFQRPGMRAVLAVPAGPVTVRVSTSGGQVLLQRQVNASGPREQVRL